MITISWSFLPLVHFACRFPTPPPVLVQPVNIPTMGLAIPPGFFSRYGEGNLDLSKIFYSESDIFRASIPGYHSLLLVHLYVQRSMSNRRR